ncbi:hypothetical protein [Sporosarcina sp. FA9]|uniref:hypothetical protein n=1 Tax=Sporosarcina sp. FA9 TaxID=3413030 RepID=UPI003F65F8C5
MRSDKKTDIKPSIMLNHKNAIYRLSQITDLPVMSVAEDICNHGIQQKKVITYLSRNFVTNLRLNNTVFIGDSKRNRYNRRLAAGATGRVSIRFKKEDYNNIYELATALGGCTPSLACALLLEASMQDPDIINDFAKRYMDEHVSEEKMKELKKVLKFINTNNPYQEELSWSYLLSHLFEEVRVGAEKIQDTVSTFVVNSWKK